MSLLYQYHFVVRLVVGRVRRRDYYNVLLHLVHASLVVVVVACDIQEKNPSAKVAWTCGAAGVAREPYW